MIQLITEKEAIKQLKIIEKEMYSKKKSLKPKKNEGIWSYLMRIGN